MVLGVLFLLNRVAAPQPPQAPPSPAPSSAFALQEEQVPLENAVHIPPPGKGHWASLPPTSGEHYPSPAAWGYTDQALPPETWVHNLEHGGVAVLVNCTTTCAEDKVLVRDFIARAPKDPNFGEVKIVNAAYPLPAGHRFALVAWGWRMYMDGWDAAAATAFYERHVNRAPELLP